MYADHHRDRRDRRHDDATTLRAGPGNINRPRGKMGKNAKRTCPPTGIIINNNINHRLRSTTDDDVDPARCGACRHAMPTGRPASRHITDHLAQQQQLAPTCKTDLFPAPRPHARLYECNSINNNNNTTITPTAARNNNKIKRKRYIILNLTGKGNDRRSWPPSAENIITGTDHYQPPVKPAQTANHRIGDRPSGRGRQGRIYNDQVIEQPDLPRHPPSGQPSCRRCTASPLPHQHRAAAGWATTHAAAVIARRRLNEDKICTRRFPAHLLLTDDHADTIQPYHTFFIDHSKR